MSEFKKIAIIGVGLIGGSVGLAIKKNKIASEVIGISRRLETILLAKEAGAIDCGSIELEILRDVDLVIFACPIATTLNLAKSVAKVIKSDAIVTDVGSTKEEITKRLSKIFKRFIGAHPLAGSEKRSVVNARADIFKGSLCILTPGNKFDKSAFKKVALFWQKVGARTVVLSPKQHDKIISFVSHLPHAVAFSLIKSIPKDYVSFGSTGLKDTTRIASSDSDLWADILLSNKHVIKAIDIFQKELNQLKSAIKTKDKIKLLSFFENARNNRELLR